MRRAVIRTGTSLLMTDESDDDSVLEDDPTDNAGDISRPDRSADSDHDPTGTPVTDESDDDT